MNSRNQGIARVTLGNAMISTRAPNTEPLAGCGEMEQQTLGKLNGEPTVEKPRLSAPLLRERTAIREYHPLRLRAGPQRSFLGTPKAEWKSRRHDSQGLGSEKALGIGRFAENGCLLCRLGKLLTRPVRMSSPIACRGVMGKAIKRSTLPPFGGHTTFWFRIGSC